ncbi:MAG: hypothetical protein PHH59_01430 [Methylovulum sp.]|uniref:hypothetical protein n=1 Tax=Methylovulum sp. TaxID=1916980 RepID=UPI002609C6B8|nr:hypothetical protein [Methylovulum sp.]MDD2722670.1 hypothetical protein [Methylovulum sp.]MDD5125159.1 hypothetical protein [Methylovulum sp.]
MWLPGKEEGASLAGVSDDPRQVFEIRLAFDVLIGLGMGFNQFLQVQIKTWEITHFGKNYRTLTKMFLLFLHF